MIVNFTNISIQHIVAKETVASKSVDSIIDKEATNYPNEFLNSLDLSRLSPHIIHQKAGVPIILGNMTGPSF